MLNPSFTSLPTLFSFPREGTSTFRWNFNAEINPVVLSIPFADVTSWGSVIIKLNGDVFELSCLSVSSLDTAIKQHPVLSALVYLSWDANRFAIVAKSTAVHSITISVGTITREEKLSSSYSCEATFNVAGAGSKRLTVAPYQNMYEANVADIYPGTTPSLPTYSCAMAYPYRYYVSARLDGAGARLDSAFRYGFPTLRPKGLRKEPDLSKLMLCLKDQPCQPDQRIYLHYLCQQHGDFTCRARLIGANGNAITTISIATINNSLDVQTASYVVDLVEFVTDQVSLVQLYIEKDGQAVSDTITYYVMPHVERRRFFYVKNTFGLYESVVSLLPCSSSVEFDSESVQLISGSAGVRNSGLEETFELSIDMLSRENARTLGVMLAMHGEFILDDPDAGVNRCVVTSKTIDTVDEENSMQSIKLKYKYA